eukprot:ANDGO_07471.mRNA.1 hypothetical protein
MDPCSVIPMNESRWTKVVVVLLLSVIALAVSGAFDASPSFPVSGVDEKGDTKKGLDAEKIRDPQAESSLTSRYRGLLSLADDDPFLFSPSFPLPFNRTSGKLLIDTKRFKRVRLDVGLAWNAPNSQYWFSRDSANNLLVFGFEPNPFGLAKIIAGKHTPDDYRNYKILENKRVFDSWYPVNVALSDKGPRVSKFYLSVGDGGSSSLLPINPASGLQVEREITVPTIPLKLFLDVFPFQQIPFIELLKIDAQGHDLKILHGVGEEYLTKHIACVAPEADGTSSQYIGETHSANDIATFLTRLDFRLINQQQFMWKNRRFPNFPESECFIEGL